MVNDAMYFHKKEVESFRGSGSEMAFASSEKRNVMVLFWPSCHVETQKKAHL